MIVKNEERVLARCLDSLVHQTLKEMEIIVVNDASPDHCQDIIEEYEGKCPHLKGYQKENGGLSDARNYGLQYARGQYIGFIDSDDYVETDMFEKLVNRAEKEGADLTVCDLVYEYEEDPDKNFVMAGLSDLNKDSRKAAFLSPLFAWNKLYKRDFFYRDQLRYPKGLWYEDIPVSIPAFTLSNKVAYVNEVLIHYCQHAGSIMSTVNSRKLYDIFTELDSAYRYLREHELLNQYHDEMEYLYAEHLMVYGAFRFLRSDEYKKLNKKARQVIREKFPEWKKNPYLKKKISWKNRIFCYTCNALTEGIYKKILERK